MAELRELTLRELAAFEDLVGIDLAVPKEAAVAVLALAVPLDD
ncbi:hypothetical protein [Paenarthrobacter ureafaciens]|nr:hypothetical protein [Paenarthrobacter ureafaciens]